MYRKLGLIKYGKKYQLYAFNLKPQEYFLNKARPNMLDHKNCDKLCDEKYFLGYSVVSNNDDAYCASIVPENIDFYPMSGPSISCGGAGIVSLPKIFGLPGFFCLSADVAASEQKFVKTSAGFVKFLGSFSFGDEFRCETIPTDRIGIANWTPAFVITNTIKFSEFYCAKPDNFECRPSSIHLAFNAKLFFIVNSFLSPYNSNRPLNLFSSFQGSPIYYGKDGYIDIENPQTPARRSYPFNTIAMSCDYTISLEKDIYEIDSSLISAGYLNIGEPSIPKTFLGKTAAIPVYGTSVLGPSAIDCDNTPPCESYGAYREPRPWFRSSLDNLGPPLPNVCQKQYDYNPAVCFGIKDIIKQYEETAELTVVDSFNLPTQNWSVSENCCENPVDSGGGVNTGFPLMGMQDFEGYCCSESFSQTTSNMPCSDIQTETRSFFNRKSFTVNSSFFINRYGDGSPGFGLGFPAWNHDLVFKDFKFSTDVCVSTHKAEEFTFTPAVGILFGSCKEQPTEDSFVFSADFVPMKTLSTNVVRIEVYYCKKTYTGCAQ